MNLALGLGLGLGVRTMMVEVVWVTINELSVGVRW